MLPIDLCFTPRWHQRQVPGLSSQCQRVRLYNPRASAITAGALLLYPCASRLRRPKDRDGLTGGYRWRGAFFMRYQGGPAQRSADHEREACR